MQQKTPKTPITQKQFEKICDLISSGKSLRAVCKQQHVDPHSVTKYMRIVGDPSTQRYALAKEESIETLLEDVAELEREMMVKIDGIEDVRAINGTVQAYKLKIDNIKWFASKLKPKKYGDRIAIDGGLALKIERSIGLPDKSPEGDPVL